MSEYFPTRKINGATIEPIYQIARSEAISGKIRQRDIGGSYYQISISLAPMNIHDARQIQGFLARHVGGSFKLRHPLISNNTAGYAGNIQVSGSGQKGKSIIVSGMQPETTIIQAGDYLKFANHNKVYMATQNLISTGAGTGILEVSPRLMGAVTDGEDIIINDVEWTVTTLGAVNGLDLGNSFPRGLLRNNGFTVNLREAF